MQITKWGYRLSYWGFKRHKVEISAGWKPGDHYVEKAYTTWRFKNPRNRSYHYCNSCHSFDWHYPRLNFSVAFSFCLSKVPSPLQQSFNKKLVATVNDTASPWAEVK